MNLTFTLKPAKSRVRNHEIDIKGFISDLPPGWSLRNGRWFHCTYWYISECR